MWILYVLNFKYNKYRKFSDMLMQRSIRVAHALLDH